MKPFKFRLDSALSLRSFAKKMAALALAEATARRTAAAAHVEQCSRKLDEAEQSLKPQRGIAMTADAFLRLQGAVAYSRDRLNQARDALREAAELENQLYHELMNARRREQGLLKLKEKARSQHHIESVRADELAVQEFINARERSVLA